jgi:DNA primase
LCPLERQWPQRKGPEQTSRRQGWLKIRHQRPRVILNPASRSNLPVLRGVQLSAPVAFDADDAALLGQVVDYYHETLKASAEGLDYLRSRGLDHPELLTRFRLGLADRTLGLRLPEKNRKAGAEIRGRLERIGIYRTSGHEHFTGSLVVPVVGADGAISEVYGRKIRNNLRVGTPMHLYLPGPHRGVWNIEGVAASGGEVILAEALIDAMTFWCAGYRNVTAAYGAGGFTEDHLAAFKAHGVARVLIAFDRDAAGDKGAAEVAERLMAAGIDVFRIQFPKGMDANAYALSVKPAAKSLGVLIRKAEWLGNGQSGEKPPTITSGQDELTAALATSTTLAPSPEPSPYSASAAHRDIAASATPDGLAPPCPPPSPAHAHGSASAPASLPEPSHASPLPSAPVADLAELCGDGELALMLGDRRYRVRGWKKGTSIEALRVNLLVHRPADPEGRFHVDTLDLYAAKARAAFVKAAGIELGEAEDVLKHDLGRVLLALEARAEAEVAAARVSDDRPGMSAQERAEAMALLTAPDLMERILADFAAVGVVGEAVNIQTGYLACVSRLLDRPLAVIIQSSSAAGKSSLMDAVLSLMPAEAQVRYSAMTGQSLFYMGETNLKHRILAIAEEEGASTASYALKLLQSDGEVTIASTGKDASTGNLVTQQYRVEGPVMLFLTTTAIDIDEELMNRCMVLTVDESREQTRAIHALQRRRQTLEGLLAETDRAAIMALHRNAQGLLEPVAVVNPFADSLTFLDDKTRTRRDHMKYLTLIRAIALLHQHQRQVRSVTHRGKELRYIEVMESDIALANGLAHEVLGRTLDELPPQTRRLLGLIHDWVRGECTRLAMRRADLRFSRRQLRALTGWGDTQLKVHLGRLADLEYLLVHRMQAGCAQEYELLYDGEGESGERFVMGLAAPGHAYDAQRSGQDGAWSAPGRGLVGGWSPHGRAGERTAEGRKSASSGTIAAEAPEMHLMEQASAVLSYPHGNGSTGHPARANGAHHPLSAA